MGTAAVYEERKKKEEKIIFRAEQTLCLLRKHPFTSLLEKETHKEKKLSLTES